MSQVDPHVSPYREGHARPGAPSGRRRLAVLASIGVVAAGLYLARPLAAPILVATLVSILTAPLVLSLRHRGAPTWIAVTAGFGVDLLALALLTLLLGFALADLSSEQERYVRRIGELSEESTRWLRATGIAISLDSVLEPQELVRAALALVRRLGATLSQLLGILLLVAFMLAEAPSVPAKLERIMSRRADLDAVHQAMHDIQRFFRVKVATSAVTGLLAGCWCELIGVELPVLWGLTAFLLNFIPVVGSLLAAGPPIVLAALFMGPEGAIAAAIGYFAINMVVGNIIEPRVMGRALGLSPLVVLLSLMVWGALLGPVGALVSPALTVLVKAWVAHTSDLAWVAELLSAERVGAGEPLESGEPAS